MSKSSGYVHTAGWRKVVGRLVFTYVPSRLAVDIEKDGKHIGSIQATNTTTLYFKAASRAESE